MSLLEYSRKHFTKKIKLCFLDTLQRIIIQVNLFLGTETYQGTGSSIKLAKQNAAVQGLRSTKYQSSSEKKYSMNMLGGLDKGGEGDRILIF